MHSIRFTVCFLMFMLMHTSWTHLLVSEKYAIELHWEMTLRMKQTVRYSFMGVNTIHTECFVQLIVTAFIKV